MQGESANCAWLVASRLCVAALWRWSLLCHVTWQAARSKKWRWQPTVLSWRNTPSISRRTASDGSTCHSTRLTQKSFAPLRAGANLTRSSPVSIPRRQPDLRSRSTLWPSRASTRMKFTRCLSGLMDEAWIWLWSRSCRLAMSMNRASINICLCLSCGQG